MTTPQNTLVLDAINGLRTEKIPVWLMRQAGRYQPEYRALREKVSFLELCHSPTLCSEVAVRSVEQLGVDAAILFADILLILEPMGIGFHFGENDGPKIPVPVRTAQDVERVCVADVARLDFVMDAVRTTSRDLKGSVPLLGFSGAPFTLASYMIEGAGSKDYQHTKTLMWREPQAFSQLLARITESLIAYLNAQIESGVHAVQVFDSWVGALGESDYREHVLPHMKRLFQAVKAPTIHFGTGNPALYTAMHEAGATMLGIDHRASLESIRQQSGATRMQGNLDPIVLFAGEEVIQREAARVIAEARALEGYIFNLGHGCMPGMKPELVKHLVDVVHQ